MIYNGEYSVVYYKNIVTGINPVYDFINALPEKDRGKVFKYIEYLREQRGILDEPYSRHIRDKLRELRVDFSRRRYRIFYFAFIGRKIILLHAFLKVTKKTPEREIRIAEYRYRDFIHNYNRYNI